jgi:hypothetical protein
LVLKKTALLISLLSLISAVVFNEVNLRFLKKDGVALRENQTVITADDISYFRPAMNFLEHGQMRDNSTGNGAYLARSPGYSFFLVSLGYIFGKENLLLTLKILQLLLFGVSVWLLFYCAWFLTNSKTWTIAISAIYGISGIAAGFIYYTLTEGLTPFLVLLYAFLLVSGSKTTMKNSKITYYVTASAVFSFLFLTRPVLGILGLALPFFLYRDFKEKFRTLVALIAISGIIAISLSTFWQVRNWRITGSYAGLHPIYYPENSNTCFRPTHEALWNFCKSWGEEGSRFHGYVVPFWTKAIRATDATQEIENIIRSFPENVVQHFGREKLVAVLRDYEKSIHYQKYYYDKQIPMTKELPEIEKITIEKINRLTSEFRSKFWLQYHFLAPAKVFNNLAFHSNLSLYVFQKTFRGNPIMELLRIVCFIVHSAIFFLLIVSLFIKTPLSEKLLYSATPLIYLFFLIYFQRGIEERYTLPVLGLALVCSALTLKHIEDFLRQKNLLAMVS